MRLDRHAACLEANYGLQARALTAHGAGLDIHCRTFRVSAREGEFFLKLRRGSINEAALKTSALLASSGVDGIVPPVPTKKGEMWAPCGDEFLILFEFIEGELLADSRLSDENWRGLGRTLRAVHSFSPPEGLMRAIRQERFDLPCACALRNLDALQGTGYGAARFLALLRNNRERVASLLEEAESLRRSCHGLPLVLCHADLHPWNILVDKSGRAQVIDWEDGPLMAPRERDFIFLRDLGGQALRDGYGGHPLVGPALRYFWLEREIEDIASTIATVLGGQGASEAMVDEYIAQQERYFGA